MKGLSKKTPNTYITHRHRQQWGDNQREKEVVCGGEQGGGKGEQEGTLLRMVGT